MPGQFHGKDVTIQDVFEGVGACVAGLMTERDLRELENNACPGAGACGGQFTANTMSTAAAFLGISPMGANDVPATDPRKLDVAFACGELVMKLFAQDIRPSQITYQASAGKCSHFRYDHSRVNQRRAAPFAIAREAGVPFKLADFDRISSKTPIIVDLKPSGRFVAPDLETAGGMRLVAKRLMDAGLLQDSMTVSGKKLFEEGESRQSKPPGKRSFARYPIRLSLPAVSLS